MRQYGLRLGLIIWLGLFFSIVLQAGEAKGYKIVLASYPSFNEAKLTLHTLETKIKDNERSLQKQYHFEIVARPSGKAFIVAIEPLENKTSAGTVMKQFKHLYPNAYINGYYGPTEGSIFMEHASLPQSDEVKQAEVNVTKPSARIEENISAPVKKMVEEKSISTVSVEDEPKSNRLSLIWPIAAVVILFVLWRMFRSRNTPVEEFQVHSAEDRVEMIESEAEMVEELPENIAEENLSKPGKVFAPEPDVFYKLKKNIFFVTLLGELKEAADSKDEHRCHDLIDEVLRYQKNFRKSDTISKMERLVKDKEFSQLSAFINHEMD
jgi:hypothetical protein